MIDREHSLLAPPSALGLGSATLYCIRALALLWFLASCLLLAAAATSAQTQGLSKVSAEGYETLVLHTRNKGSHRFHIEIAATPVEQSRGLMFRTSLPANYGMLFLHDPPQRVVMWMKNTYLPLDMVFLDREGKVVQIVERTTPLSLVRIRSLQPVAAVLELAAGSVQRHSLGKGDRVEHPFFSR